VFHKDVATNPLCHGATPTRINVRVAAVESGAPTHFPIALGHPLVMERLFLPSIVMQVKDNVRTIVAVIGARMVMAAGALHLLVLAPHLLAPHPQAPHQAPLLPLQLATGIAPAVLVDVPSSRLV